MELRETTYSSALAVDREKGLIRGVKILGRNSRNGRSYSEQAIQDSARLYEGIGVNIDHPESRNGHRERRISEAFGRLAKIEIKPEGVYGELEYLRTHALASQIAEAAERMPEQLGLSHVAEGITKKRDGQEIVEAVKRVYSVDLVRDPATNSSLFESTGESRMARISVKELVGKFSESVFGVKLLKELEQGGELPGDLVVEVPASASPDDQIKAAFRSMVLAAFDDEGLDAKATLKKIGEILKAQEKLMAKEKKAPEKSEESPTEESAKGKTDPTLAELLEEVRALKRDSLCRRVLDESGVRADETKLAALAQCKDEGGMRELAKTWTRGQLQPALRSAAPLREGGGREDSLPKDSRDIRRRLGIGHIAAA